MIPHLEEPAFAEAGPRFVAHAFFTRAGGVSTGIYASLNCGPGSQDHAAAVEENRSRAALRLGLAPRNLVTLHQIHSARCITVDGPWPQGQPPEADALATATAGLALGVLTADCAPVLFAGESSKGPVIGAAHAGWKGAVGGVLESTLSAMLALGAEADSLTACIGPCIRRSSYAVSEDFLSPFLERDPQDRRFFTPADDPDLFFFDLPAYVAHRLAQAGIDAVYDTGGDTQGEDQRFFSFRRATLRGQTDYGRQLSAILIRPA